MVVEQVALQGHTGPYSVFVVGSPKGDLGHLGDLLPKRGLLKVTFLFKSLLSERKDYGDVLYTSFAAHEA